MLKISQAGKPGQTFTLKLEGRVVGPWVNELRATCESLLGSGRGLRLDLSDVTYADTGGAELLMKLREEGATLLNGSPFLNEQLKATAARTG